MSREIKFRIWLKDEDKYGPSFVEDNDAGDGYGPLEYDDYYIAPETGAVIKHHNHREFGDWMYSVEGTNANREVEIEQYTGLKDKNGKEIYEGDIVKFGCGDQTPAEVVYQDGSYFIKALDDGTLFYDPDANKPCPFGWFETYGLEVIGNIHENPELLGDKE